MQEMLTLSEVAEILACCKTTAERWLLRNNVPALHVGVGNARQHRRWLKKAVFSAISACADTSVREERKRVKNRKFEQVCVADLSADDLFTLTQLRGGVVQ